MTTPDAPTPEAHPPRDLAPDGARTTNVLPAGWTRSVATLFSGSALGTLLTFAVQPLLTRLFPAAAFGTADLLAAVLSVLFPLATLRYDDALLLPENEADAAGLFWLGAICVSVVAALTALVALVLPWARLPGGYGALAPLAGWIVAGVLVLNAHALTEAWLTRQRRYRPLSTAHVARGGVTSGVRLLGAALPSADPAAALSAGFVVGIGAAAAVQAAPLVRAPGALGRRPTGARLLALARRYRRFALFTAPAKLFQNVGSRLPVLLLAAAFAPEVVGLFGRVVLVVATPLGLVGSAVARVFVAHAPEARRAGTLAPLTDAFHRRLVFLGLYPALALCLAGPDLFAALFGAPWREAGVYAQATAPWLLLAALAAALSVLFDVTESQRLDLATGAALTAGLGAALWVGTHTGDARLALALAGGAGALLRLGQLGLLLRLAGVPLRRMGAPYAVAALASAPGLALVAAVQTRGRPFVTAAAVAVGAGVTYAILWRTERRPPASPPPATSPST